MPSIACMQQGQTTDSLHLSRSCNSCKKGAPWRCWVPIAHGHALMVASNLDRKVGHSTVVETSQSYKTANIGVGCDALGWPNKILRCVWVTSIETWRLRRSPAKVSEHYHQIAWRGFGRRIDIAGPKSGSGSRDTHIAYAMHNVRGQK
jgi:hypothetical protein